MQALAVSMLGAPLFAARAADAGHAWASSFARYDGPFNRRFPGELKTVDIAVEGRLPDALRGTFYRNGPARMRLGSTAYHHWFDGDGMVQAFRLGDGKASHHGVVLRTPKLAEEEMAGRFLYSAFGTTIPDARPAGVPDRINTANINLLSMNGGQDLYALWEAGSALKIDPGSLQAHGFKVWSAETAGAPFSAHPRVAPDGTVWSFGYMPGSGKLLIYEIGADGILKRQRLLDAPQADMVHDFAITEHYLIFLLMPLKSDQAAAPALSMMDRYRWHDDKPLLALLVDKRDFSTRRFELPAGGVFHLGNAWEAKGMVHIGYVRQTNILATLRNLRLDRARDAAAAENTSSEWTEVELDLHGGSARQHVTAWANVEFPRFDSRHAGNPTSLTLLMQRSAAMPPDVNGFDSILALRNGHADHYRYGAGWIAEEHIHVPQPDMAAEGSGWILGTAYHWPSERTTLSVFDARQLANGPVAQMRLPYGLPLGLHGQFVAA
jgi:carotenoid cleavage dioxygenase-like enzyme